MEGPVESWIEGETMKEKPTLGDIMSGLVFEAMLNRCDEQSAGELVALCDNRTDE